MLCTKKYGAVSAELTEPVWGYQSATLYLRGYKTDPLIGDELILRFCGDYNRQFWRLIIMGMVTKSYPLILYVEIVGISQIHAFISAGEAVKIYVYTV